MEKQALKETVDRLSRIYQFDGRTSEIWDKALRERKVREESHDHVSFFRLEKDIKGIERGTILAEDGIVKAYPHIKRILHLKNGINRNFTSPFQVEEKVDGYNVRVAEVSGEILAFSRGGFICPFSTDRVRDFIPCDRLFEDLPNIVLCCEVAGPENPYNTESPPYIKEDIQFFVFDIMEKNSGKLFSADEKDMLSEKYGLPKARGFGIFSPEDWMKVKEVLIKLNKEGCEGVVMKPVQDRKKTLKYVTSSSSINDIDSTIHLIGELPAGYYIKRIIMTSFFMREFGLPDKEISMRFGEHLFTSLMKLQDRISNEEEIQETYKVRIRDEENIDRLYSHLRRSPVDIHILSRKKVGDYFHVQFTKTYRKATSFIRKGLKGSSFID